jgi:hypothetical protein
VANTRHYGPTVQLDSGLIIPASAGKGKVLMSSSTGAAEWSRKVEERSFAIAGVLAEKLYPGFFIRVPSSGEKKLIAVEYAVAKGEFEFELRKGTEALTGFTALKAKTTAGETEPTAFALASKNWIRVKGIKLTEAPEDLSLTLFLEI